MELNIKLIGSVGRLNKREPFILADNEKLVLNFNCATPLTDYYIELKNGDKSAKYRLNAVTSYEVPKELLQAGTLEVTVSLLYCGKIVVTYTVEPIVIAIMDNGYKGFAELDEVKAKYDLLMTNYNELVSKINQVIDTANRQQEDIQKLYNAVEQGEF